SVLKLDFDEPIELKSVNFEEWISDNAKLNIDSIIMDDVFRDVFTVTFGEKLKPDVVENFTMQPDIQDLAENELAAPYELPFGFPGRLDSFDVVINELMFDPPSEGADYVEIFNRSDKIISLDSLCLARNDQYGNPEELVFLSDRIRWLLPEQYLCLTEDVHWVKSQYQQASEKSIMEIPGLPNYINEGGTVFLTRLNGEVIDQFDYAPNLHFELLSETKGVALERTNTESNTNNVLSWHSASSTSGYGTPGLPNSQLLEKGKIRQADLFELSPEIFTPNLDGTDDQLIISYAFEMPGQKGSITVFDVEGNEVRRLVDNQTLGTSGQITWDGISEDHRLSPPGIYIIWGQVFDLNGHIRVHKASCVLGVRD
ncbi:MAG TPA: lamin tail domain-containing protein, partial [Bacteroidales bacterium]|nr:lamin tail domain-containing protein [Bacteroidales bacterium]